MSWCRDCLYIGNDYRFAGSQFGQMGAGHGPITKVYISQYFIIAMLCLFLLLNKQKVYGFKETYGQKIFII